MNPRSNTHACAAPIGSRMKTKPSVIKTHCTSWSCATLINDPAKATERSDPQDQADHHFPVRHKHTAEPLDASELPTERTRKLKFAILTGYLSIPAAP